MFINMLKKFNWEVEIGVGARNALFNLTVNIPLGTGTAMIGHVCEYKRLVIYF